MSVEMQLSDASKASVTVAETATLSDASKASVTLFGTCRLLKVHNSNNINELINYTHSTKEVIQQIKFMKGELDIPSPYNIYCFRTGISNRNGIKYTPLFKQLFDETNIFVIEICTRKNYKYNNFYLHHLCVDPRFDYYYKQTPATIKNNCIKVNQTNEEIEQDLLEIRDLLAPRKMIVVSHYNSKMNGEYIPARAELINFLEVITTKHKIPFVNPTEVLKEYPQVTVMCGDLGHYFKIGEAKIGEHINKMIKELLEKP